MTKRYTWIVLWMPVLIVVFGMPGCGDDGDDSDTQNGNEEEAQFFAQCEEMVEAYCTKAVECDPLMAKVAWGVDEASQCAAAAKKDCTPDSSDDEEDDTEVDTCVTTIPSEALVNDCIDAVESAACEDVDALWEAGPCAEIDNMMDCDDGSSDGDTDADTDGDTDTDTDTDTDADSDSDTDADTDADTDSDADPVEINVEGCVAAVSATCAVAQGCADSLSGGTGLIEDALAGCEDSLTANEASIASACESYLTEEVANGDSQAIYLNEASAADIEACASGENCNIASISSLLGGLSEFLASGDPADLAAVAGAVLVDCPVP